ncbi:recombinase family protein [Ornithinimicrobium sp. INDO-MA30-4]|uniref:recombinase family protein n=1 Tax=Ornithinimicrobium sp. INDO-MA30-4 TaxID=2908651 RepID=UPI001F33AAE3|nr:recombinase family protein [Ornithinimicrobium sp. INDO-MA30-4]UJH70459.1 recombinase family protein [Ornithinimicrobium sp. INDO-MA30-4]
MKNRYYVGVVTFEGVEYKGKHQALVSEELYKTVQRIRAERYQSGDKPRVHTTYMKGSIFCGQCGHGLSFEKSRKSRVTYTSTSIASVVKATRTAAPSVPRKFTSLSS